MLVNVLLLFLCVLETLQHLSYPINFCNMASTCIHDSRVVCASSPDGCSRKSFLDQCDMYEYNCDFGTRYQETYILFCGTLLTSTQFTQIHSIITKDPTRISTSSINPSTVPLTVSTSTPVTSSVIQNATKNDTTKNYNHTTVNQTTPVYCCDRPLTWETTKEITHIFEDLTIENNNSEENEVDETVNKKDESKHIIETSIAYNITDNLYDQTTNIHENENDITFTTINQEVLDTVTLDDTTTIVNTETNEAPDKKLSVTKVVTQNSPVFCCNRPLTWETTTELTHIFEDITTENNNTEENRINNTVNGQDENKKSTETPIAYNITDNLHNQNTNIHENENDITLTTIRQQDSDTVTLHDTTLSENNKTDKAPDKQLSVTEMVTQNSPVSCCNRPSTWETTREVTTISEITTENNSSEENKINRTVPDQDRTIDGPTNIFVTVTDTTVSYSKITKKYSTTSKLTKNTFNKKLTLFSKLSTCKTKCQRPLTWLTTLRRRKEFSHINCDEKCLGCQSNFDHTKVTTVTEETEKHSPKERKKLYLTTTFTDPPTEKSSVKNRNGCGRPVTWETTAKGETRDFYRVLNV